MKQSMTCICCPLGCNMEITKNHNEHAVAGNKCLRGKKYAIEELTAPKRVITSTIKITDGLYPVIPVKTDQGAPKDKIFEIMKILANTTSTTPIRTGDIIIENIANTEVNIVATKTDLGGKG